MRRRACFRVSRFREIAEKAGGHQRGTKRNIGLDKGGTNHNKSHGLCTRDVGRREPLCDGRKAEMRYGVR